MGRKSPSSSVSNSDLPILAHGAGLAAAIALSWRATIGKQKGSAV